jgi:uncharacterized phage protein (TIGR01671 family)
MREILFRGKREENDVWIWGGFNSRDGKAYIIGMPKQGRIDGIEVDPKTVGQYTGLTDKNGTKIFEGDIVEVWYKQRTLENNTEPQKYKAIIVFGNPNGFYSWGYQLKMIDDFPYNNDILLWVEMEDTGAFVEVIGNIHDNPELLAKK